MKTPYRVETLERCSIIHGPGGIQISVGACGDTHEGRAEAWARLLNEAHEIGGRVATNALRALVDGIDHENVSEALASAREVLGA